MFLLSVKYHIAFNRKLLIKGCSSVDDLFSLLYFCQLFASFPDDRYCTGEFEVKFKRVDKGEEGEFETFLRHFRIGI